MNLRRRIGSGLISLGILLFLAAGWILYRTHKEIAAVTKIDTPVKLPLTMRVGHVRTKEFITDRDGEYGIYIQVDRKAELQTLLCLLGMDPDAKDCADTPSVVSAEWTLSNGGQIVAQGKTRPSKSFAPDFSGVSDDAISDMIDHFESKEGQEYLLDLNVLTDGTLLAPFNPHLVVASEVNAMFIAYDEIATKVLVTAFFLIGGILLLIGIALL
jgi:hypothetical protein